ncbi:MAG TPA: terminase small subunit [Bacteroidales bacterium]|nr:terminase small subunit [Bacteroidales bacterium]
MAVKAIDKKKKLSDTEISFCNLYVKYNFNATRAYFDVYKCKNHNTAGVLANRLIRKAKIKEYIGTLVKDGFIKAKISRDRILNQLSIQSFQQIDDYIEINPKTRLIRFRSMDEIGEKGAAIQSMKIKQISMVTGEDVDDIESIREPVSTEIDLKLRPNEKSLELLMKYSHMITDSVDHSGTIEVTRQVDLSKLSDGQLRQYLELSKLAQKSEEKK